MPLFCRAPFAFQEGNAEGQALLLQRASLSWALWSDWWGPRKAWILLACYSSSKILPFFSYSKLKKGEEA